MGPRDRRGGQPTPLLTDAGRLLAGQIRPPVPAARARIRRPPAGRDGPGQQLQRLQRLRLRQRGGREAAARGGATVLVLRRRAAGRPSDGHGPLVEGRPVVEGGPQRPDPRPGGGPRRLLRTRRRAGPGAQTRSTCPARRMPLRGPWRGDRGAPQRRRRGGGRPAGAAAAARGGRRLCGGHVGRAAAEPARRGAGLGPGSPAARDRRPGRLGRGGVRALRRAGARRAERFLARRAGRRPAVSVGAEPRAAAVVLRRVGMAGLMAGPRACAGGWAGAGSAVRQHCRRQMHTLSYLK